MQVGLGAQKFEHHVETKAIYATGWDGNVVLEGGPDGVFRSTMMRSRAVIASHGGHNAHRHFRNQMSRLNDANGFALRPLDAVLSGDYPRSNYSKISRGAGRE